MPLFEELSEEVSDELLPLLDRVKVDEGQLSPEQKHWRHEGYLVIPSFIPNNLIDAYCAVREKVDRPYGWACPVPYMHIEEIRNLCLYKPLMDLLQHLIGDEMMLHLNLTGWVSTERDWHQDDYLNPDFVNSWYAAVWFVLDDIHPDCGPFEFVPRSHQWPLLRGDKVRAFLSSEEVKQMYWVYSSEKFVSYAIEEKIERSGLMPKYFLGRRGDILIWHSRLAHRGSAAKQKGMKRKAIIAHYSAVSRRPDMPISKEHNSGAKYAVFDHPLD